MTAVSPSSAAGAAPAIDPEETAEALLRDLGVGHSGLGAREAERRLRQHGPNEIRRLHRTSHLQALAVQLVNPLALLLWAAAGFALVEGTIAIAVTIVVVILLNAG